jgi:predicted Fe-S protein YdhL (DUF1289 family)
MAVFNPCQGKTACRDDGAQCLTCGRSIEEIAQLRELLRQLAALAVSHDYENVEEYAQYISAKVAKLIDHQRSNSDRIPIDATAD